MADCTNGQKQCSIKMGQVILHLCHFHTREMYKGYVQQVGIFRVMLNFAPFPHFLNLRLIVMQIMELRDLVLERPLKIPIYFIRVLMAIELMEDLSLVQETMPIILLRLRLVQSLLLGIYMLLQVMFIGME